MTLTRWKLLAGVFGISVCGFAALAEPACRSVGTANRQESAVPESKMKGSADTEPKATAVVEVAPPELPVPATIAPVPAVIPLIALAEEKPAVGVTTPAEVLLPVQAAPAPLAYTGPLVTPEEFARDLVPPVAPLSPKIAALPGADIATPPTVPPAPPHILAPTPKNLTLPDEVIPSPTPAPQPIPDVRVEQLKEKIKQLEDLQQHLGKVQPELPIPAPQIRQVEASRPVASDKKLKVTLQMDEGNPKFEVRDGEEVVLKVVSDKVDVASPTQKGDRWSTLKACGQVKFATPGGDGSCDSLQVVPGTGEVVAVGNVKFTYNWGKVETSASSEKMNFRLGTAAAAR